MCSAEPGSDFHKSRELRLPLVTIFNQLSLVVKQFFAQNGCVFEIRAFYNCVYWAGFLAQPAEYAFGHVDIIKSSSSGAIRSWLCFNDNCKSGAGSLT